MRTSPYTVRLDGPIDDAALRKFALTVSDALVRLSKAAETTVIPGEAQGTRASWTMALYDEATGMIAFLPGVRFVPVGANDVSVGFELDISPRVGSTTNGTAQGYMANYGVVNGSKLVAGMSANNEDPNIPRVDLGFKSNRGATLEMYGNDGDTANTRKGQLRATLGPGGILMVYRYIPTNTTNKWEVIGGFGPNGELLCGYRNGAWPASLAGVVNVYAKPSGADSTTTAPVATIDAAGVVAGTKLKLNNGAHSVTLNPTGFTSALTLTLQQKTFVGDSAPSWVLCAAT